MNRRGLFKMLAMATAAAAMQVTGLKPISAAYFKRTFSIKWHTLWESVNTRLSRHHPDHFSSAYDVAADGLESLKPIIRMVEKHHPEWRKEIKITSA